VHAEIAIEFVVKFTTLNEFEARKRLHADHDEQERMTTVQDLATSNPVTYKRSSDGYINATMLRRASERSISECHLPHFLQTDNGRQLKERIEVATSDNAVKKGTGIYGGNWIHPTLAKVYALRCGFVISDADLGIPTDECDANDDCCTLEAVPEEVSSEVSIHEVETMDDLTEETMLNVSSTSEDHGSIVDALKGDDGQMISEIRHTDGYVNATMMCVSVGKRWAHFFVNTATQNFLKELRRDLDPIEGKMSNNHQNAGYQAIKLIESNVGRYGGTWVHPRVGIYLATWCSAKFAVRVTDVIIRYMQGKVTTDESLRVAAEAQTCRTVSIRRKNTFFAVVDHSQMHSPRVDDVNIVSETGRPDCTMAPGVAYLLRVGIMDGIAFYKYGWTDDFKMRHKSHKSLFSECCVVFVIECGRAKAIDIETTISEFTERERVHIKVKASIQTECFAHDVHKEKAFVSSLLIYVKQRHIAIINNIVLGPDIETVNTTLQIQAHTAIAYEATKQIQAREESEQLTAVDEMEKLRLDIKLHELKLQLLAETRS
jgi:hypothetical protein